MNGVYNFENDEVSLSVARKVRSMFSGHTHEERLVLLAPMIINCSDSLVPVIQALIEESEQRGYYQDCLELGIDPRPVPLVEHR